MDGDGLRFVVNDERDINVLMISKNALVMVGLIA
jgi:hypothetical protein